MIPRRLEIAAEVVKELDAQATEIARLKAWLSRAEQDLEGLARANNETILNQRQEILEEAAQLAESLYDKTYWDDPSAGIAARLRQLARGTPAAAKEPEDR